jgi:predicted aspartyl protease
MIKGRVNAHREALIPLPLRDSQGEERAIEAVIDTGYNGFLTLPPDLIKLLGRSFAAVAPYWVTVAPLSSMFMRRP